MSDQSQNGPQQDPNAQGKPEEANAPETPEKTPGESGPFYLRPPFIGGAVIAIVAVVAIAFLAGPSGEPASTEDAMAEDTANDMTDLAANPSSSNWELGRPGDIVMGSPDAPVKMVEYASLTCGHCAAFKLAVFPDIKKKYIDTGLVQYTMREFPTPPVSLSIAGFMLARCTGEDRYYQALEALFRTQPLWVKPNPQEARAGLEKISRQFGINEAEFETCINNEQELERIRTVVEVGSEVYGVNSTPSFVINGRKADIRGASFEAVDSAIRGALPEGTEVPDYTPSGYNETGAPEGEEGEEGEGAAEDEGAADEDASDEGASGDEGTSEEDTSEGTSDEGTSDEGASDEGTSEDGATDEGASEEEAAEEGASEEGTADDGTADEESSDDGAAEEGASDDDSDGSDSGDGGEEGTPQK